MMTARDSHLFVVRRPLVVIADVYGDIVAWLCERAPLWVVVHVCALLRAY